MKKLVLFLLIIFSISLISANSFENLRLEIEAVSTPAEISDLGVDISDVEESVLYDFYCAEVNVINGWDYPIVGEHSIIIPEGITVSIKDTGICDDYIVGFERSPVILSDFDEVLVSNRNQRLMWTPLQGSIVFEEDQIDVGQVYYEDKDELVIYHFEPTSTNLGEIDQEAEKITEEILIENEIDTDQNTQPTVTEKVEEAEDTQNNEEETDSSFQDFIENNFGFVLDKIPVNDPTLRFYIFVIVIVYLVYLVVRR